MSLALPPRLEILLGFAALHVFGDQHLTVEDPHQMLRCHRLDRLPGQHDRHPIPKPAQRDQPVLVDPTLHHRISRQHLPYYLDEFTFRFNRRTSRARGLLFYRLLQQAAGTDPHPLRELIGGTGNDWDEF